MKIEAESLTPKQIVEELNKYIIKQDKAKRSVAIALRNRIRRRHLSAELRDEVAPKNIIMIGPTGVGKTEIARRLAKLVKAPFLKVEATKYTEVGYVGRDVESMIRDLMHVAVAMTKAEQQEAVRAKAEAKVEERLLNLLLPETEADEAPSDSLSKMMTPEVLNAAGQAAASLSAPLGNMFQEALKNLPKTEPVPPAEEADLQRNREVLREALRRQLREGKLEEKPVTLTFRRSVPNMDLFAGANMGDMEIMMGNLSDMLNGPKKKKKTTTVKNARQAILAEELDRLVDNDSVADLARERVEQMGIIFIDEIDKIAAKENRGGADVSREGVQRDILPIVEGSRVSTKYGVVDTTHILFIAAGAFHMSRPSDLIPELQGRFPIRVELEALTADDFYKILTEPENALITQYTELMKTEEVRLTFTDEAISLIAELAEQVNNRTDNIGARRLHTLMELLLEDVSFNAPDLHGQEIVVTPSYVDEKLGDISQNEDLSRYVL